MTYPQAVDSRKKEGNTVSTVCTIYRREDFDAKRKFRLIKCPYMRHLISCLGFIKKIQGCKYNLCLTVFRNVSQLKMFVLPF